MTTHQSARIASTHPTKRDAFSRTLSFIIFAALIALVFLAPIPYGSVEPSWTAALEVALFALSCLWFIESAWSRRFLSREQLKLFAPLLALAIYAFMQTIPFVHDATPAGSLPRTISFDPYQTSLFAVELAALIFALAMWSQYGSGRPRLIALAFVVIAIALASAVFGLIRQIYQHDATGFVLSALEKDSGYAQFINKNHFAFLAEMGLGLLLGLIGGGAWPWSRSLIYFAVALPIWTALILSNSRGGILAMLSQIIFFLLARDLLAKRKKELDEKPGSLSRLVRITSQLGLMLALVGGIVIGTIWIGGESLAERLSSARREITESSGDTARVDRANIWKATWQLSQQHALTGIGFGGYWIAITRYHQGSGTFTPQQAHNDYLELFASGGLVGAGLFIWFAFALFTRTYKQLHSADRLRRALALGAATGLFGIAVHSLVDFGLHLSGNALVCISLIAIATVDVSETKTAN